MPVWVTECEPVDLPDAKGGTGLCGGVRCATGDCWPRYARAWNPLLKATDGPIAVAVWAECFRRDPAQWIETDLALFQNPPPTSNRLAATRTIAVVQAWEKDGATVGALLTRVKRAAAGWVIALDAIDQSWEPRLVPVSPIRAAGAPSVAANMAPTMNQRGCKDHWEDVYRSTAETGVSWYQEEPRISLELINAIAPERYRRIVDIGGGASRLVDSLLELQFATIAVLDISETALGKATTRLGERSRRVKWITADVTSVHDIGKFDVWHDRAVFHFLTEAADRERYVELARRTVPEGGHLIIATFAKDGPKMCSGLDVRRYDANSLREQLAPGFLLVSAVKESHTTPWASSQPFFYGVFRRQTT